MLKRSLASFRQRLRHVTALAGVLFFSTFALMGCQSTDPASSYATLQFKCNPSSDGTLLTYRLVFHNESIYDMKAVHYSFNLFHDGAFLHSTDEIHSRLNVHHGDTAILNGDLRLINIEVDDVDLAEWYSDDLSFWETYQVWFIVMIVLVVLGATGYIIWVFVEDEDLGDVWEDITDVDSKFNWIIYCLPTLLIAVFAGLIPVANVGWVPLCIIAGGIIVFIILGLLGHLVHHFVSDGFPCIRSSDAEDSAEPESQQMTKNDLLSLCRAYGLSGYSALNKDELIELLTENGVFTEDDDSKSDGGEPANKQRRKSAKKAQKRSKAGKKDRLMFDAIAGLEEAKQAFEEKVILPFKHPDVFRKYKKQTGGGILLYGLPGTGKTMFAEAAANEVDALFIPIKCSDIKSKWYGESENRVKKYFARARNAEKAIIFFDEFEAIGAKRTDDDSNGNNDLVAQILAEMQGIGSRSGGTVVVIAATNKPWAIDSAFLRPDRFDERIYIPLPDLKARLRLFELNLKSVPKEEDLDLPLLAERTEGFSGADIKEICEKFKMLGIKESLSTKKEHKISNSDIGKILPGIRSSVSLEDIERLKVFNKQ